jgi:23S rRNA (uridine2552-2'-O)-methyltransferase
MDGLVIGIDLVSISPINGVIFIEGDATCQEVHAKVASILEEQRRTNVDAIISDMAPKLSGNRAFDQMRSYELCIGALNFARKFLKPGGSLVIKAFQGEMFRELLDAVRPEFKFCKSHSPRSSKARSAEIYIIAKGYNVTRSAGG